MAEIPHRITSKSLAWERAQKDNSRVLRGKELREAEEKLAGSQNEPQPTELQRFFVLTGRQHNYRQRRRVISGLVAGFLVMLGITTIAVLQWQRAEENARRALARQLAAQAQLVQAQFVQEDVPFTFTPNWPELRDVKIIKPSDMLSEQYR